MKRPLLRLLRIELRRNEYRWLVPLLLIGAWLAVVEPLDAPVLFWDDASVRLRNTVWLLGPFAAMIAAWMATRERRFAVDDLLGTTARPALIRKLVTLAATVISVTAAYALVGLYVLLWTAPRASSGGPVWSVVLTGLLGIVAYAALGFGWGALKPRRASAFAAFLVLGLVTVILAADSLAWTAFLTPVPSVETSPWRGVAPDLLDQQLLVMLGWIALGFALLVRAIGRGWRSRIAFATAATLLLIGAGSLIDHRPDADARQALLLQTDVVEPGAPAPETYQPVCRGEEPAVCVHPAYAPMLDEAAQQFTALHGALAPANDRPARIDLLPALSAHGDSPSDVARYLLRSDDVEGMLMDAMHRQATALLTAPAADLASAAPTAAPAPDGWQTRNVVLAWALAEAGRPIACQNDQVTDRGGGRTSLFLAPCEPLQRFRALDPAQRQAWLRDHLSDLRAGLVPVEELP